MANEIYYAFVIIGTSFFCVSIVLLIKKPFFMLSASAVRQLDIIMNASLGDKEKDKLILKNLARLLLDFFTVILLLSLSVLFGLAPVLILAAFEPGLIIDTGSIYFYISMLLGSFSLFLFRKTKKSDYSYWSELLHTIILNNYNLGKYLFYKGLKIIDEKKSTNSSFVIVTGLARAGTTALTNLLYDPNTFHSIKYSNMPFLLAPNFWKKVYNPKSAKERERSHGDKVFFSENSIEALEEYFFKVFMDDSYIHADSLSKHEIDQELFENYLAYQELFKNKQTDNTTYLAKNNNLILRYESMRKLDENFNLVVVFRNPLDHAGSLLSQHNNFVIKQKKNDFVLTYMNWLGHYEFGLNQKYFHLNNEEAGQDFEKDSLNFWLAIWINFYSYLLQFLTDPKLYLVHYDDLAKTPCELKHKLAACFDIHMECEPRKPFKANKTYTTDLDMVDDKLLNRANEIYEKLIHHKIMMLRT